MRPLHEDGEDPDYRFSLANERTFLAWVRTALAILAGALMLHQFAEKPAFDWMDMTATIGLCAFAALLGAAAYFRWRGNEYAMRHSRSLPRSMLIPALSFAIATLGAAACVVLILA
jgi:putative membrane protein